MAISHMGISQSEPVNSFKYMIIRSTHLYERHEVVPSQNEEKCVEGFCMKDMFNTSKICITFV